MSTDLELSLYNARSRRHSVALTRIVGVLAQHIDGTVCEQLDESREVAFEHHDEVAFEVGSLDVRDLGGGRGCDTHVSERLSQSKQPT